MPAAHGRAQRLRCDPRPRRRQLSARSGGQRRAGRPSLPPGHAGAGDELGHLDRLGDHPRRPADGSLARGPPAAERLLARPDRLCRGRHPHPHGPLRERRGPGHARLRARVRLRATTRGLGARRSAVSLGDLSRPRKRPQPQADDRPAGRLRGAQGRRAIADEGRRLPIRRAVVGRDPSRPRPTRTATSGSSGRRTTGSTGSPAAASPITRGARISSAARSRSVA